MAEDVAYMRLLARLAYVLTLGEVDLMPVVREPRVHRGQGLHGFRKMNATPGNGGRNLAKTRSPSGLGLYWRSWTSKTRPRISTLTRLGMLTLCRNACRISVGLMNFFHFSVVAVINRVSMLG